MTGRKRPDRMQPRAMRQHELRAIVDLVEKHVLTVRLYNWDEPFMVREIIAIIRYARSKGLVVTVHLNMTSFDQEKAKVAVESGLMRLCWLIDVAT